MAIAKTLKAYLEDHHVEYDMVEHVHTVTALESAHSAHVPGHQVAKAVVLEDYLDIRPERRERFLQCVKERKLVAGPWYVLPDEWLISGESYIRNLMTGMRVCREHGVEPSQFAYTPDQFGHIAALPMIMTGLGLKAGLCWRGAQNENYPGQFMWVGPDGSRMATFKLADARVRRR